MNLNSIKDKLKESKLINSVFRNPVVIAVGFLVIAISLVNFSASQSNECPAILTYDEISQSISLHYCKADSETYHLEALDKSGVIQAKQVQYTVNGTISVSPWSDSKITVNSLPDYVLINLIFSDACFKNNSTDVSFPIDLLSVSDCGTSSLEKASVDVIENSIVSEELEMAENVLNDDSIVESENDEVPVNELTKLKSEERNTSLERLQIPIQEVEQNKSKPFQIARPIEEVKESETVIKVAKALTPSPSKRGVSQQLSSVDVKTENIKIDNKQLQSHASGIEEKEYVSTENSFDREENTFADHSAEVYTGPIEPPTSVVVSSTAMTKPISNVNLFNTKTIGIEKSCISTASKIESQTDLFTTSIKPHKTITLYDVYCYAAQNSDMTITLSQLGKIVTSFSVSLNKGENQIGLTSLGLLEANEAYLIECKTTNKGDVNLFSECKSMATHSNEIVIRYLDNHNAFYGLTYEIEI